LNLDFSNINVLLIGDFMVDSYFYGSSVRQSPEAPVPVIKKQNIEFYPGGAGNVAMNLRALGASVTCLGCIGNDEPGKALIQFFKNEGIDYNHIFFEKIPTTQKKRYFSNGIQILRIDEEKILEDWIPKSLEKLNIGSFDIIILSDYNKGVLNKDWFKELDFQNIIVDPKKDNFSFYSNAKIITPNLNELERVSQIKLNDYDSIKRACNEILIKTNLEYIVAKMGEKGMMVVGKNNYFKIINPYFVENPDVTGAGDTVIASFSLAYAKFGDVELAAKISNAAASIAVSKKGTAVVETKEIESLFTK